MSTGKKILATRKLHPSSESEISSLGMKVDSYDFITKRVTLGEEIKSQELTEHLIITSKTAATALGEYLLSVDQPTSLYKIFCTSPTTEISVKNLGFDVVGTARDAASLADVIIDEKLTLEVTHLCSSIRRPELSYRLAQSPIDLKEITAYRVTVTPIQVNRDYDAVLFFSPSSIDSFLSVNDYKDIPCFCIGATTGGYAREKGYIDVYIPEIPSEKELIKLVLNTI